MTFTTGGSVTFLFSFEGGNTLNQAIPVSANLQLFLVRTILFTPKSSLVYFIRRYDISIQLKEPNRFYPIALAIRYGTG